MQLRPLAVALIYTLYQCDDAVVRLCDVPSLLQEHAGTTLKMSDLRDLGYYKIDFIFRTDPFATLFNISDDETSICRPDQTLVPLDLWNEVLHEFGYVYRGAE